MRDTDIKKHHDAKVKSKLKFEGIGVLSSRAYFSTHHIWAAEHFSKLAADIEDNHEGRPKFNLEHRIYVINSILSAVAFLEAAINEFYQNVHDQPKIYKEDLAPKVIGNLSAYWAKTEHSKKKFIPTLKKYQKALRYANKEEFNENENLYKDVQLVIKLRHFLTHYKPMDLDIKNKHELDDMLREKFLPNKMMDGSGNNFFPDKALGKGCVVWSHLSIKDFADEFFYRMGVEPNYQKVDINKLAGNT